MGCHEALGLYPFEPSPVPQRFGAYGLPDKMAQPPIYCMDLAWPKVKAIQDELRAIAGELGSEAKHG
jgi:hypothetical protein